MRSKKKTRITSLCMPLPIRMGITKGQWIYLLADFLFIYHVELFVKSPPRF